MESRWCPNNRFPRLGTLTTPNPDTIEIKLSR